jgi:hypothetical protein
MDLEVDQNSYLPQSDDFMYKPFKNMKVSFLILLSFVVGVYIIIFSIVNTSGDSRSIIFLEMILWVALIIILYVNIKNYDDNNLDFQTKFKNLFNSKLAELEVNAKTDEDGSDGQNDSSNSDSCKNGEENSDHEVFHLTENKYTYQEAQDACKALNARIATYDEVERAYNNGGNWCSYGWSEDQLALFPIQKSVYNELKKIKGHENDCGRPGVNGGYIKNPHVKFGVNCYGKKPEMNEKSKGFMESANYSPAVPEEENIENDILITAFNKEKWSEF